MQIHSISKVLIFPLVIVSVGILYYSATIDRSFSIFIFLPVFIIVALYVFNGPLDHWWKSKYPIQFDPKLRQWLQNHFEDYNSFNLSDQLKFEYRLGLYMDGRLFKSVGSELRDVPEDIKCMVAAHGVRMCLGLNDYLIGDIDRIFLYKHPFPTPEFPFLHTVETNIEDGVIILSLEQLTNAILTPSKFYNIADHAYAEAFIGVNAEISFPDCDNTWKGISLVSGFSKEDLQVQTGFENLPELPLHIVCFFNNTIKYKEVFPNHFKIFSQIFNCKS